jgi:hypothetical protein
MSPDERLISILDRYNADLARLAFGAPVAAVYNPHEYARAPWEVYLRRYGATEKRVIFLGMNSGPWGMAQTGVPFGEVSAVREWMGIDASVQRPGREHPKRPILGMACTRSEVSGRRLWDLFASEFGTAEAFFRNHLVVNYCPLVFMAESGRKPDPRQASPPRTGSPFRTVRCNARGDDRRVPPGVRDRCRKVCGGPSHGGSARHINVPRSARKGGRSTAAGRPDSPPESRVPRSQSGLERAGPDGSWKRWEYGPFRLPDPFENGDYRKVV